MSGRIRLCLAASTALLSLASAPAFATPVYSFQGTIPIAVGTNKFTGYDLSVVDPTTQLYYLTDRSAGAIDVISTTTNTLVGRIGQNLNLFGGVSTGNNTAGPNGISISDVAPAFGGGKLLLAGNTAPGSTVGNVIAFNLAPDGLSVTGTRTINTVVSGVTPTTSNRVDGVAYSPVANTILAANNASTPGVITVVDNATGKVVGTPLLLNGANGAPNAQGNGVEGPIYNTVTKTFFVAIPNLTSDAAGGGTGAGGVVEIDPATGALRRTFDFGKLGLANACNPNGVVQGPNGTIGIACGTSGTTANPGYTLFLDPAANGGLGKLTASTGVTGADQIAYDTSRNLYFEAARYDLPSGTPDPVTNPKGGATPNLGIFDGFGNLIQRIGITNNDHSVAVDPVTGEVLVAFGASSDTARYPNCTLGCVAVYSTPEPGTMSIVLTGMIGLGAAFWRRRA